jgi:hypothetical protein
MAPTVADNHGAEAVRVRLNALDPGKTAYDRFFGVPGPLNEGTARKLIEGHNEVFAKGGIADDVEEIKRDLIRRPF